MSSSRQTQQRQQQPRRKQQSQQQSQQQRQRQPSSRNKKKKGNKKFNNINIKKADKNIQKNKLFIYYENIDTYFSEKKINSDLLKKLNNYNIQINNNDQYIKKKDGCYELNNKIYIIDSRIN